ncbi:hypothetical protein BDQ17DRAFT_1429185 [Cyathus striatus]|nr:hypothetical protein BDQ17DRAFT_1429185 [Cyathus striatus]
MYKASHNIIYRRLFPARFEPSSNLLLAMRNQLAMISHLLEILSFAALPSLLPSSNRYKIHGADTLSCGHWFLSSALVVLQHFGTHDKQTHAQGYVVSASIPFPSLLSPYVPCLSFAFASALGLGLSLVINLPSSSFLPSFWLVTSLPQLHFLLSPPSLLYLFTPLTLPSPLTTLLSSPVSSSSHMVSLLLALPLPSSSLFVFTSLTSSQQNTSLPFHAHSKSLRSKANGKFQELNSWPWCLRSCHEEERGKEGGRVQLFFLCLCADDFVPCTGGADGDRP